MRRFCDLLLIFSIANCRFFSPGIHHRIHHRIHRRIHNRTPEITTELTRDPLQRPSGSSPYVGLGQAAHPGSLGGAPTTRQESRRTVSFIKRGGEGEGECICFRHHSFEEDKSSPDQVSLQEQGPRFDLRLYQIKLGTVDQTWAENEWVLRPFHNSKNQKL